MQPTTEKHPLDHETLRDVIDLALWAGQMLLHAGAQTQRIERTVHRLGTALGANWMDVIVMPEGLVVTTASGQEFRTRVRRVTTLGVDLSLIASVNTLTRRVMAGELDRFAVRAELERLDKTPSNYNRWVVMLLVGLACAAFSRLFGGDWPTFGVTFVASCTAMFIRQMLMRHHFNRLLVVIITAFVAGVVPGLASWLGILPAPESALAASVLLLVPGVPLINAARDILRGYLVAGTARGVLGFVVTLCIALGLLVALQVTGVKGLAATSAPYAEPLWLLLTDALWSGIAALGFAVLFNAPRRLLPHCFAAGAVGHALRAFLILAGLPMLTATLIGAIVVGLLSEYFAVRLRTPGGVFSVPGAIPMVPGAFAFRAMIGLIDLTYVASGPDTSVLLVEAIRNFVVTGLILAALAVGTALPSLIVRRERPVV